ncbi:MAG: biopolymer transporter ExbD [bacterium]
MNFYTRRKRPLIINIVSLVDILTILLIFFIVTMTFKKIQPTVKIDLPESSQAERAKTTESPLIISVSKEGVVSVGNETVKIEKLASILKAKKTAMREQKFALEADQGAQLGVFVKVLDAAKEAGIENLSLHTKEPNDSADRPLR